MNMKKRKTGALALASTAILSACTLPGLGSGGVDEGGIQIATQSGTEMIILGYIVEGMVEHYMDVDAEIIQNLGSSTMVNQALVGGDANIAGGRYTGTVITGELGMDATTDPEEAQQLAIDGFAEQYEQKWYESYGFENTYAFMVTQEVAEEYGLETVSDLEEVADELTAGIDDSWMEREGDGYNAFVDHYGFEFGNANSMQIGLVYGAVQSGDVDIVLGYSTDGRIASYELVVLEDDQDFFPPYDAAPSATFEVLEEYEELDDVLLKLEGIIDEDTMQELNYVADDYLLEPATVAREFLEANNYFEDHEPILEPVEGGE